MAEKANQSSEQDNSKSTDLTFIMGDLTLIHRYYHQLAQWEATLSVANAQLNRKKKAKL